MGPSEALTPPEGDSKRTVAVWLSGWPVRAACVTESPFWL